MPDENLCNKAEEGLNTMPGFRQAQPPLMLFFPLHCYRNDGCVKKHGPSTLRYISKKRNTKGSSG